MKLLLFNIFLKQISKTHSDFIAYEAFIHWNKNAQSALVQLIWWKTCGQLFDKLLINSTHLFDKPLQLVLWVKSLIKTNVDESINRTVSMMTVFYMLWYLWPILLLKYVKHKKQKKRNKNKADVQTLARMQRKACLNHAVCLCLVFTSVGFTESSYLVWNLFALRESETESELAAIARAR